jgi:molecular chaperone Hsp33
VRELLGEVVSASVLLAATLKFRGTLTLQLQGGSGAARLLVAQCTHDFRVRAVVRADEERLPRAASALTTDVFHELVGSGGRLVVTVEADEREARYQGVVPLEGDSFAECLEEYFAASEQLPTRVRLAADEAHAAGLLVQRLPGHPDAAEEDAEAHSAWEDAQQGIGAVDRGELLGAPVERVLSRNFGERDLRVYSSSPVRFECRCGPERVANLLRALGADEVRDVLAEQGAVTVTCDFCNRPYRFGAAAVEALFAPRSVH